MATPVEAFLAQGSALHYWALVGSVYLLFLSYLDIKTMTVDDRFNWFMIGVTVSLISFYRHPFSYVLLVLLGVLLLRFFLSYSRVLGRGDVSSMFWIFWGLALINIGLLAWYSVFFTITVVLYYSIKYFLYRKEWKRPTPFMPALAASFIAFAFINGLYW